MLLKGIILFCLCTAAELSNVVRHDVFTGKPVTEEQLKYYQEEGVLEDCTQEIAPCDETEGRRTDGSCNNLKHPGRGIYLQPLVRVLPAHFFNGSQPYRSLSGKPLASERKIRIHLLKTGDSSHICFNHNIGNFLIFLFNDIGSVHDVENQVTNNTKCCEVGHRNDPGCTPHLLDTFDPVHRFSGIDCLNGTKAITLQDLKCTKDSVPSPIAKATSSYDLSQIYNKPNKGDKLVRSGIGGKLSVEEEEGRIFPPNAPTTASCLNNEEGETRCFANYANSLLPVSIFVVWFVRNHNDIATKLAEVNPCWDDDKLFNAAREINIAWSQRMYLYEVMPALVGRDYLIKNGVITEDGGFRDIYDEDRFPEVTVEYSLFLRWFHLMQEPVAKYHDKNGVYLKDFPLFNITFRMGYFPKHMVELTQSTFRAPCRDFDYGVSHEMADHALPTVQLAVDGPAGDLNKGRYFGVAPYIDYVRHFTGLNITCFEDLEPLIEEQNIKHLRDMYEYVQDIEALSAMWVEKKMKGGEIPLMMAHFLSDQIVRSIKSDRHWFERPNRPNHFTKEQLCEMKKATLSALLCNVGDDVTEVPENSFLTINCPKGNPLMKCTDIPQIDYSFWRDSACDKTCEK